MEQTAEMVVAEHVLTLQICQPVAARAVHAVAVVAVVLLVITAPQMVVMQRSTVVRVVVAVFSKLNLMTATIPKYPAKVPVAAAIRVSHTCLYPHKRRTNNDWCNRN